MRNNPATGKRAHEAGYIAWAHARKAVSWNELQDLPAQALGGNEGIITNRGKPVARIVPVAASKKNRVAGRNRGTVWTSEDFDEPLPDEFWLGRE